MNIVFMGTPDFSVEILKGLLQNGHNIIAAYTQPDKKSGRGHQYHPTPVKEFCNKNKIPVFQPHDFKSSETIDALLSLNPDVYIVAAYGKILPAVVFSNSLKLFINVHASILPVYRGAAPIQWAIRNKDRETGISIMKMDEGMDTGPVYAIKKIQIDKKETSGSLFAKLSVLGRDMLIDILEKIVSEEIFPVEQNSKEVVYAPIYKKEDEKINWNMNGADIESLWRSLMPKIAMYTFLNGKRIKIQDLDFIYDPVKSSVNPGQISEINKHYIKVKVNDGFILLKKIQPEGKRIMNINDFINGQKIYTGLSCKDE